MARVEGREAIEGGTNRKKVDKHAESQRRALKKNETVDGVGGIRSESNASRAVMRPWCRGCRQMKREEQEKKRKKGRHKINCCWQKRHSETGWTRKARPIDRAEGRGTNARAAGRLSKEEGRRSTAGVSRGEEGGEGGVLFRVSSVIV